MSFLTYFLTKNTYYISFYLNSNEKNMPI